MSTEMPYMMQVGNIPKIFTRIEEAGTPPKFTHEFLKNNLGFTGSGDRGIIKVLKSLGFLSADSVPTDRYNNFKGPSGGAEIAQGLREGWAPVFLSDQSANERTVTQLVQLFKGATGAGDATAKKLAGTFKALADRADWEAGLADDPTEDDDDLSGQEDVGEPAAEAIPPAVAVSGIAGLTLRHDVHLHLPATSDVSVYTAIFRAIREELRD